MKGWEWCWLASTNCFYAVVHNVVRTDQKDSTLVFQTLKCIDFIKHMTTLHSIINWETCTGSSTHKSDQEM